MYAPEYPTAWDHVPTRHAWMRQMAMNVVGLVGWIATWVGLLAVLVVFLSPGFAFLFFPFMAYSLYRAVAQIARFRFTAHIHRVLVQYPWQILTDVPRGLAKHPEARDEGMWFEFRSPERPEEAVPLVCVKHLRARWWMKRVGGPRTKPQLKAQIEPLWFAGDPRFIAVIAASDRRAEAPKRLHVLYQRPALDKTVEPAAWGASPADLERARRAGARVPDPDPQPRP